DREGAATKRAPALRRARARTAGNGALRAARGLQHRRDQGASQRRRGAPADRTLAQTRRRESRAGRRLRDAGAGGAKAVVRNVGVPVSEAGRARACVAVCETSSVLATERWRPSFLSLQTA